MKKIISLIVFIFLSLTISGCGAPQPKPLYSYGNYSESYYAAKKELTPESALALEKSIEYAIEHSNESRSGRVAPGMYANLGYIYLKSGNQAKAIESFEKEKLIYPESAHFMNRMIKKIEVSQGVTNG